MPNAPRWFFFKPFSRLVEVEVGVVRVDVSRRPFMFYP